MKKNCAGFLSIEILIALTLLLLSISMIMRFYVTNNNRLYAALHYLEATNCAIQCLEQWYNNELPTQAVNKKYTMNYAQKENNNSKEVVITVSFEALENKRAAITFFGYKDLGE